jgi:hypothetical protein
MTSQQWANHRVQEELRVLLYRERREYKGLTEDDRDPTWRGFKGEEGPARRYSPNCFPCPLCRKFHNRHPSMRLCEYATDDERLIREQRNFPPTIARIIYLNRPDLLEKAIVNEHGFTSVTGIRWHDPERPTHDNPDHLSKMIQLGRAELIEVLHKHNCFNSLTSAQALYYVKVAKQRRYQLEHYVNELSPLAYVPEYVPRNISERRELYEKSKTIESILESEFKHYMDAKEREYAAWQERVKEAWAIDEPSR